MVNTRANAGALLASEQVENLVVLPVLSAALATDASVARVVRLDGRHLRVPREIPPASAGPRGW
ncbi:hypothetical protein [Geodermatophilus sp. SYSU D01105]